MSHLPFQDPRVRRLLSRVGNDLAHLRQDVANLISHTTRTTLPAGARELADSARDHLSAGGDYAAARLRKLRSSPPPKEAIGVVLGVAALGLLAFGAYSILNCKGCKGCKSRRNTTEDEDISL
jgi:hypothetical protein